MIIKSGTIQITSLVYIGVFCTTVVNITIHVSCELYIEYKLPIISYDAFIHKYYIFRAKLNFRFNVSDDHGAPIC